MGRPREATSLPSRGHFVAALISAGIGIALVSGSVAVLLGGLDRSLAVAAFTAVMGGVMVYIALRAARLGRAARARERREEDSDGRFTAREPGERSSRSPSPRALLSAIAQCPVIKPQRGPASAGPRRCRVGRDVQGLYEGARDYFRGTTIGRATGRCVILGGAAAALAVRAKAPPQAVAGIGFAGCGVGASVDHSLDEVGSTKDRGRSTACSVRQPLAAAGHRQALTKLTSARTAATLV
jgi:hypothetical protein